MSRSVHSVKLTPYNSSQLSGLTYTLGDVVFDQDNLTLRVMDGNTFGGATIANQSWTQNYINTVFSQAVITVGNITNSTGTYPSGALRIAGGVSIKKDTYIDGSLTVNTNLTVTGNLNATITTSTQPNINSLGTLTGLTSSGIVTVTNNTNPTALGTGALQVSGGVSIAKDLYVGGKLFLTDSQLDLSGATFSNGVIVSGSTVAGTEFFTITNGAPTPVTKFQVDTSSGNTTIAGTLNVTGLITGPGIGVSISATAPSNPIAGSLWYNSTSGNLYVYYVDANGSNWVQPAVSNQQAGYTLPNASSSVLGGVVVPLVATSGINSANGTITLATASTTQLGGVKIDGTTITKNASGQIQYVMPTASTSVAGSVKIDGTTITLNGQGQIQYVMPTASTSVAGSVKIDGTTIVLNGQGQLTTVPITIGSSTVSPGSTISAFNGITALDGTGSVSLFNTPTSINAFASANTVNIGNTGTNTVLLGNFVHTGAIYNVAPSLVSTMDNVVIGATTPAAATFTSITVAGETITGFTDIYDFDDISYYVDGFTNTFPLTFNQSSVALASPFNIIVAIDGAVQPAFDLNYELVWGSNVLPASKGYTVDVNGNLQFAECPSMGSQIQVRSSVSVSPTPHTKKVYPFKALDIMMGF
jgi:hypothetical protein